MGLHGWNYCAFVRLAWKYKDREKNSLRVCWSSGFDFVEAILRNKRMSLSLYEAFTSQWFDYWIIFLFFYDISIVFKYSISMYHLIVFHLVEQMENWQILYSFIHFHLRALIQTWTIFRNKLNTNGYLSTIRGLNSWSLRLEASKKSISLSRLTFWIKAIIGYK